MGAHTLIGVFDSGIGGLSVLKALQAALPQEDFIYVADSGHAPYGERDAAHVLARSLAITDYLVQQGIRALVVACNTATAAAIDLLRATHPGLAIIGVEPALKPAVALSKTGRIGVMATRGTLASPRFQALLAAHTGPAQFVVQPCDGLADAIERSADTGDATEIIAACALHTGAMGLFGSRKGEIDTLVLGCTHYPIASPQLQALLGTQVLLVDTGAAVARQTQRLLLSSADDARSGGDGADGRLRLLSTGQTHALKAAASRWLATSVPVDSL